MLDSFDSLMGGFSAALTPGNLLFAAIGVLLGTAIGVWTAGAYIIGKLG